MHFHVHYSLPFSVGSFFPTVVGHIVERFCPPEKQTGSQIVIPLRKNSRKTWDYTPSLKKNRRYIFATSLFFFFV